MCSYTRAATAPSPLHTFHFIGAMGKFSSRFPRILAGLHHTINGLWVMTEHSIMVPYWPDRFAILKQLTEDVFPGQ
jgi:hypothetical protein